MLLKTKYTPGYNLCYGNFLKTQNYWHIYNDIILVSILTNLIKIRRSECADSEHLILIRLNFDDLSTSSSFDKTKGTRDRLLVLQSNAIVYK